MSALVLDAVVKSYGPIAAVRGASVAFERGVVHAVVGENGAGKSTLLKIGAGLVVPDAGRVLIDGTVLRPHTAGQAIRRGIAMVQQHFALVGVLTVLENLFLGAEPTLGLFGRINVSAARKAAERVTRELGVELPFASLVSELGVGERQRVEIARALLRDARTVILDEPTAVLTPAESTSLYDTLRRLAAAGRAVVVVTHKLDEVVRHAGRVTVLRKGRVVADETVASDAAGSVTVLRITKAIMGAEIVPDPVPEPAPERGPVRVRVAGVTLGRALAGVSFAVAAGEVVGIAGVEGNGQRELVRVLSGLERPERGHVEGMQAVAVVHEDRHKEGLVLDASVLDNLLLGELAEYTRFGILDGAAMRAEAASRADEFDVMPRDLEQDVRALSGGNQQKIVVARALASGPPVVVMAHPTRGVDVGAASAIHAKIRNAARRGAAVLLVSADLSELRATATRILVMSRGAIVAELPPSATDAEIGACMVGAMRPSRPALLNS